MKKNNIIIKGLQFEPANFKDVSKLFLASNFDIDNIEDKVRETKLLGKNKDLVCITLDSAATKSTIMKAKREKARKGVFINHDLTYAERERAFKIRKRVRAEKQQGKTVKTRQNKLQIDGADFFGCQKEEELNLATARHSNNTVDTNNQAETSKNGV